MHRHDIISRYYAIVFMIFIISSAKSYILTSFQSHRLQTTFPCLRMSSASIDIGGIDDQNKFCRQISTYCGVNGLMYTDGKLSWSHAPVAAFPSSFPRSQFQLLKDLQPIYNILIDRISRDREFLLSTHAEVRKQDSFTDRLLQLYESLPPERLNIGQIQIGIHRSDYMMNMMDDGSENPLQIEINTIASSFGCLSSKVGLLHRHTLSRHKKEEYFSKMITSANVGYEVSYGIDNIPDNVSQRMQAFALSLAHVVFGDNDAIMLFIVQPYEKNVSYHRLINYLFP
jgi:hypothetical protein